MTEATLRAAALTGPELALTRLQYGAYLSGVALAVVGSAGAAGASAAGAGGLGKSPSGFRTRAPPTGGASTWAGPSGCGGPRRRATAFR